jgi:hypothetical protein
MVTDNPVIRQHGFEVVGTDYGGWIIMRCRSPDRAFYADPFIAAFSTFEEMLAWLGKQTRHDNMPSPTSDAKPELG